MDNLGLELQKALSYIDENWRMQNNYNDYKSNFIYKVDTVNEVINLSELNGVDYKYALHRWYNFKTSIGKFFEGGEIVDKILFLLNQTINYFYNFRILKIILKNRCYNDLIVRKITF